MTTIKELMQYVVTEKCSDLHISTGVKPMLRKDGDIISIDAPVLTANDVKTMVREITTTEQFALFEKTRELDFSFAIDSVARFRINAFYQSRGMSLALRALSFSVPTLEEINLQNPIFKTICNYPTGLVLITGGTGSGKSTTLAALINFINQNPNSLAHILTIEDPIEYLFNNQYCLIQQREIGRDTLAFQHALRASLREDPDIILIGEMRDLETIRLALTAAETGHLVLATLHTSSASHTIDRIIDVFPGNEKDMVRAMLAESLRAIISQRLFKATAGGMYPATEILVCTDAVRNLIREHKIAQLYSVIQTGRQYGMHTMEQNIAELLKENKIFQSVGVGE